MRELIDAWWHGGEYDTAAEELARVIEPFGTTLTEAELRDAMAPIEAALEHLNGDDAEDDLRRHQIGWAARRANAALVAANRSERLRAFAQGTDSDTSGWVVIESGEYERLLAERGAPEELERSWDDPNAKPWIRRERRIPPDRALSIAKEGLRTKDFALAERAARVAYDRGDVLLGALALMEALALSGQKTDAQPIWRATAERWLQGFKYPILPNQWQRLLALHADLDLPKDDLFARCPRE